MSVNGLRPYRAYSDSRMAGTPSHWTVVRLKNLATVVMGQSPSSRDCSSDPIGVPFLQGCADFGSDYPHANQYCSAAAKMSPHGAVLVSVRAPVGRINVADRLYGIGRGLCAVVPKPRRTETGYLRYALGVSIQRLLQLATGSTYDAVSVGDVAGLQMIAPPVSEQRAIVRFLDHANRSIRRYIRAKERLIELLEERKRTLIHEAVTDGSMSEPASPIRTTEIRGSSGLDRCRSIGRYRGSGSSLTSRSASPSRVMDSRKLVATFDCFVA